MNIRKEITANGYRDALREIEMLMAAELGTNEGSRLDALVTLVEAYERKHCSAIQLSRATQLRVL